MKGGAGGDSQGSRLTRYPRSSSEKEMQLENILEKDPGNLHAKKTLAFTYYTNQKFRKAIELYFRLSTEAADDPAVHFYMGNTLFRLQSFQSAVAAWLKAIDKDTSGIYTERARQRISMTRETYLRGNEDE